MKSLYFFDNDAGVRAEGLLHSVLFLRDAMDPEAPLLEQTRRQYENQETLSEEKDSDFPFYEYNLVKENCRKCKDFAVKILECGQVPVLVAGDHSISMGSVAATASFYKDLTVVWVDAHADINTEKTSLSGNIHGMPLASLLELGSDRLNAISGKHYPIRPENLIYLGLRDLDPGEIEIIERLPIKAYWYEDIKRLGLANVLHGLQTYIKHPNIHLSLDLDSIDPLTMPAVSVPVPGGFSLDEVREIIDFFGQNYQVRSYDLVEYNALLDSNQDALMKTVDLIQHILK